MRLVQFSVTNFRSILKAEKLPLGEFTVLLGPNNEGKSNILQAMVMGMQALARPRGSRFQRRSGIGPGDRADSGYTWHRDFPQNLQDGTPDGRTTMRFDFQLTDEEVSEFYDEVGSRLNEALPISLSFGPTGTYTFRVRKPRHAAQLSAKQAEIAEFVAARVEVQYVGAIRTGQSASRIVAQMLGRELSAASADNPEIAVALEKLREMQQPVFDRVSAAVTTTLRDLLPDVESVRVDSRVSGDLLNLTPRDVSLVVDDGTPTELQAKGDGVQSLAALAMMQHYSQSTARAREFILAVEEPEAHLHPRAVHGLRDALRATASKQQVIITTHSPLFANRLDLASNIIVRKNRAQPAKSVRELREALGVRTADNLASAEMVLVVEGMADERALRPLLAARSDTLRSALADGLFTITRLHGAGKLNYLLAQLGDSLSVVHALLDNDEEGKQAAKAAQDEGLLQLADLTMTTCQGARESEFEDMIDPEIYRQAFQDSFGVSLDHNWLKKLSKGKWSSRMPTIFEASGTIWTTDVEARAKTLVADAVAANSDAAVNPASDGIIAALVESLESKLRARLAM